MEDRLFELDGVFHEVFSDELGFPGEPPAADYTLLENEDLWMDLEGEELRCKLPDGPLFRIALSETEEKVLNYMMLLRDRREISGRLHYLTTLAIKFNPSNYTAWSLRLECVKKLRMSAIDELGECINSLPSTLLQILHER